MITIHGGQRESVSVGRRLNADEIRSALGGATSWRIEARVMIGTIRYACLTDVVASTKYRDLENVEASRICGRIIWGPAVFLELGVEI